jgi:hypothetical protein
VDGRGAGEVAGKSEANQVPAKVEEKVAESRADKKHAAILRSLVTVKEII